MMSCAALVLLTTESAVTWQPRVTRQVPACMLSSRVSESMHGRSAHVIMSCDQHSPDILEELDTAISGLRSAKGVWHATGPSSTLGHTVVVHQESHMLSLETMLKGKVVLTETKKALQIRTDEAAEATAARDSAVARALAAEEEVAAAEVEAERVRATKAATLLSIISALGGMIPDLNSTSTRVLSHECIHSEQLLDDGMEVAATASGAEKHQLAVLKEQLRDTTQKLDMANMHILEQEQTLARLQVEMTSITVDKKQMGELQGRLQEKDSHIKSLEAQIRFLQDFMKIKLAHPATPTPPPPYVQPQTSQVNAQIGAPPQTQTEVPRVQAQMDPLGVPPSEQVLSTDMGDHRWQISHVLDDEIRKSKASRMYLKSLET